MKDLGRWAFIIGLIIALVVAFLPAGTVSPGTIAMVLFILGLIIGFLNISSKETTGFLVAIIALIVVSSGTVSVLGTFNIATQYLVAILSNFIALVAAAGLVVSIKEIIELSKN